MRPRISLTLKMIQSRCKEEGNCWIWQGGTDGHGRPQARHEGRVVYVRRLARELADRKPMPRDMVAACSCGNLLCVSPECSVRATQAKRAALAVERGAYRRPARMAKMISTKRAGAKVPESTVAYIRTADGPCSRISMETGVSVSHVKAIRRGDARRDYAANPFAALFG